MIKMNVISNITKMTHSNSYAIMNFCSCKPPWLPSCRLFPEPSSKNHLPLIDSNNF